MNILLAAYGFYPYHTGGSELYVRQWAAYLQAQGHQVGIVAAVPPEAITQHPQHHSDQYFTSILYQWEGLPVLGVQLRHTTTTADIYHKYRPEWLPSWRQMLAKTVSQWWPSQSLHLLHVHAHSPVIGRACWEAAQSLWHPLHLWTSLHTPGPLCPQGDLLYLGQSDCKHTTQASTCAACMLARHLPFAPKISEKIAKTLANGLSTQCGQAMRKAWPKAPAALHFSAYAEILIQECQKNFHLFEKKFIFSRYFGEILRRAEAVSPETVWVRHGVRPAFFRAANSPALPKPQNALHFAYVGRAERIKGAHTLLNAWLTLPPLPDKKLYWVGDTDTHDTALKTLFQQAARRPDVAFLGSMDEETLAQWLATQIHCVIIPSEWVETGPMVFHEAIACRANIIASDVGGCRELADFYDFYSKGCTLFRAKNHQDLQKRISEFAYRPLQPAVLAQVMSEAEHFAQVAAHLPQNEAAQKGPM